ncbi:uncharacterized protein LOC143298156 [Babylonia areolata]|uniref:uncharacterized protein LOC143298156 n=1 Tax=Babylonia areolata TaxID=304850 RepID=UPI003FCF9EF0
MQKSLNTWLGADKAGKEENAKPQENQGNEAKESHGGGELTEKEKMEAINDSPKKEATTYEKERSEAERKPAATTRQEADSSSQDITAVDKLENTTAAAAALDKAKQVGNILYSFGVAASSAMVQQASKIKTAVQEKTLLLSDVRKEQEKVAAQTKVVRKREEDAVPPWVGYREEETMKEHILGLSQERKIFLNNPPSDVKFEFDFATAYPVAMATLREDANLRLMRYQLVPKRTSEETFWRNYFYHVSLVKRSVQLDTGTRLDSQTTAEEEEDEEEEEEEEWEKVQREDMDQGVTAEGGGGEGSGTFPCRDGPTLPADSNSNQQRNENDDEDEEEEEEEEGEMVDLLKQIERETQQVLA